MLVEGPPGPEGPAVSLAMILKPPFFCQKPFRHTHLCLPHICSSFLLRTLEHPFNLSSQIFRSLSAKTTPQPHTPLLSECPHLTPSSFVPQGLTGPPGIQGNPGPVGDPGERVRECPYLGGRAAEEPLVSNGASRSVISLSWLISEQGAGVLLSTQKAGQTGWGGGQSHLHSSPWRWGRSTGKI